MPAFVKSSVGSCAGTRGEERTTAWPFFSKYSRKRRRRSLPVIMVRALYAPVLHVGGALGDRVAREQGLDHPTRDRRRVAPADEVIGEPGRHALTGRARQRGQPAPASLHGAVELGNLFERRADGGRRQIARDALGPKLLAEPRAADAPSSRPGLRPPPGEALIVEIAAGLELGDHGRGDLGGGPA